MTDIWFDHFITYTSAVNLDHCLKEYAAQGFLPAEKTVRHNPGLRNGFIFLGPEYIELCWVEDEPLFATANAEEKAWRTFARPFGIGMMAEDVNALHAAWTARGYSVPEVWSAAPRDATPGTPPVWSFQDIPGDLLPGASCFALTYHSRPTGAAKHLKIPPNTIYAVFGATFVAAEPAARATCWRNLLAPYEQIRHTGLSSDVLIGPHRARWMTPDAHRTTYGLEWVQAPHPCGELALLHLLASDLGIVRQMLEQAGRQVSAVQVTGDEELLVAPDARDGLVFAIRQYSIESWLQERMARTGEKLKVAPA